MSMISVIRIIIMSEQGRKACLLAHGCIHLCVVHSSWCRLMTSSFFAATFRFFGNSTALRMHVSSQLKAVRFVCKTVFPGNGLASPAGSHGKL